MASHRLSVMARAIGYIRVSTGEQVATGLGLDAQRAAISAWCSEHGHELVAVMSDEGVSGGADLEECRGLLAAIDATGDGVLVVLRRDRLARETYRAAMVQRLVERRGGRIEHADGAANGTDPASQLMRGMLDAFAQFERQLISARTREAMARGKVAGAVYGRPMVQQERDAVELALQCKANGISLAGTAQALTVAGIPRSGGAAWNPCAVRRMLAHNT